MDISSMLTVVGLVVLILGMSMAVPTPTTTTTTNSILRTTDILPVNTTHPDENRTIGLSRELRSTVSTSRELASLKQLYCRSGSHLQILNGSISGTRKDHDKYAIVNVLSIRIPSIVAIRGAYTGYFLAMNEMGQLYASKNLTEHCHFREVILENMYNTYASAKHPMRSDRARRRKENKRRKDSRRKRKKHRKEKKRDRKDRKNWYVALDKNGEPRIGPKSNSKQKMSQFLARPVDLQKLSPRFMKSYQN
ncbi:FGF13-like protein isoform X1 [Saccoglossus kowalevskii]|uniref:Fibroblast growth factor n=1 Tax=Saccoglossus kowalevskii TaxID=10224 RepID=D1LX09_SACKO|nr:FGF13-like protein precursor [Saccoglossus kowalevskii]ACY92515.1 FGF13-like protein [Saccoglossus kowalevskii]